MPRLTAEEKQIWEERIRDYQISGLSLKKYCEQADLAYHRMQYHWKQRKRSAKRITHWKSAVTHQGHY